MIQSEAKLIPMTMSEELELITEITEKSCILVLDRSQEPLRSNLSSRLAACSQGQGI